MFRIVCMIYIYIYTLISCTLKLRMQRTRICFGDGTLGRQLVLSLEIDSDSIFGLGEYDHLIQDGAPQLCLSVYKPL